jgi:formylmethanofuran dehydrogenase subunit E
MTGSQAMEMGLCDENREPFDEYMHNMFAPVDLRTPTKELHEATEALRASTDNIARKFGIIYCNRCNCWYSREEYIVDQQMCRDCWDKVKLNAE